MGPDVVEGINANLLEGGRITGVVTSRVGGAGLAEVEVCAIPLPPLASKSCDETNASGEYSLRSLPSGLDRVGFWRQGTSAEYESTYYEGKSSLAQATPVTVTEGHATAGVDAELVEGGRIMGTVFAVAGGMPLGDIAVCLFSDGEVAPRRCSDSAADGTYTFQGLPSGSYQVGYSLDASEITGVDTTPVVGSYASQYYDGAATRAQAATISLLAPGRVEGVDAHLSGLSILSPSVTAPLAGSPVSAGASVVPAPEPKAPRCKVAETQGKGQREDSLRQPPRKPEAQETKQAQEIRAQPVKAVYALIERELSGDQNDCWHSDDAGRSRSISDPSRRLGQEVHTEY